MIRLSDAVFTSSEPDYDTVIAIRINLIRLFLMIPSI